MAHDSLEKTVSALADQLDSPDQISFEAIEGSAVPILLTESANASLLVLGSRQAGTFGSILGSVGAAVAARAECPTVVLRGPAGLVEESPEVVVGIDDRDSDSASALLTFGFDYASRHGVALNAVLCLHPDPLVDLQWRAPGSPPVQADAWLAEALAGWREKYPDVASRGVAITAHPTAGLVQESLNQELLVVGTRGHHALAGTLLGSVSQGVLHHAYCPVAVIPTHRS
jgi:nucleotide-binding universal stress UspA family protein